MQPAVNKNSDEPHHIRFDVVQEKSVFDVPIDLRAFYQAEILIPAQIPPNFLIFPCTPQKKTFWKSSRSIYLLYIYVALLRSFHRHKPIRTTLVGGCSCSSYCVCATDPMKPTQTNIIKDPKQLTIER